LQETFLRRTVNARSGQLQSFRIGSSLYTSVWSADGKKHLGYEDQNGKSYNASTEPNIGVVQVADGFVQQANFGVPAGGPPTERTWQMPAIFDYDMAAFNDLTPDAIVYSLGAEANSVLYSGSAEVSGTLITKGISANPIPYLSASFSIGNDFSTEVSGTVGGSVGSLWSLSKENNFLFTRDMIEGSQISGSINFSVSAALKLEGSIGFEFGYDGNILDYTGIGNNTPRVKLTDFTIKGGLSVGADATPGPGATGSLRYGYSTPAWHPLDLLKR
jgi:hypothetical protein